MIYDGEYYIVSIKKIAKQPEEIQRAFAEEDGLARKRFRRYLDIMGLLGACGFRPKGDERPYSLEEGYYIVFAEKKDAVKGAKETQDFFATEGLPVLYSTFKVEEHIDDQDPSWKRFYPLDQIDPEPFFLRPENPIHHC